MRIIKAIYNFIRLAGIDIRAMVHFIISLPRYIYEILYFKINTTKDWPITRLFPIFSDKKDEGGTASGHYFHQDLYFARKIYENKPRNHCDIGSRVDGFVAHVAVFRKIDVIDIRPISSIIENIEFVTADMMQLPNNLIAKYSSVSCLHALEHFGLGRYGDPLNLNGFRQGFTNMAKLLDKNGIFYLSVPIGKQRIEFNAHRIFDHNTIIDLGIKNNLELINFDYVDDSGKLVELKLNNKTIGQFNSSELDYSCGLFTFKTKMNV